MAKAYKLTSVVEPGHRIVVVAPEVEVGNAVEVIVFDGQAGSADAQPRRPIVEYLDSLPPRRYTVEQWAEIEADLQRERDAWDR